MAAERGSGPIEYIFFFRASCIKGWLAKNIYIESERLLVICRVTWPGSQMVNLYRRHNNTGWFEMIVGVLTTCHKQYTWDRSIRIFFYLIEQHSQVFVAYPVGALYVQPLWSYKHQHDNRVRSKLFVACQRWRFQWQFWFVPSIPGYLREKEEHKPDPWRNHIERN